MERDTNERRQYDEPFKQAATHFLSLSGRSVEEVSTELGLKATDLRNWKRKYPAEVSEKIVSPPTPISRLQAENKALRDEILRLRVQWDILKTTLGILSASTQAKGNSA